MNRPLLTLCCGALLACAIRAPAASPKAAPARPRTADPAVEQRNQDSAFSLLMETYQMIHQQRIESDYQNRLRAALALPEQDTRSKAVDEAKHERNQRLTQLESDVHNFIFSYLQSRTDEETGARPAPAPAPAYTPAKGN